MTTIKSSGGTNMASSARDVSSNLFERVSNFLRGRSKTVSELNDAEFLSLFDIPSVRRSLGRGYNLKSMAALVEYYRQRVGKDWLEPPCMLADLGFNTATASDQEILAKADLLLGSEVTASAIMPSVDAHGDIDWNRNLQENCDWLLRVNRQSWWPLLGYAYLLSADERYALAFARQLSSWMNANFPLDEHNSDSPIWSSYQVAYRLRVSWIPAFGMFYESPHFNTRRKMDMLRCIFDQARFLKRQCASTNTLLNGGLVSAAISFPEMDEAGNWRRVAIDRFRVDLQGTQGVQSETSDSFWSWNLLASSDRELAQSL